MIDLSTEFSLLAQSAAPAATAESATTPVWVKLLTVAVIFVVPFLLGNVIARALKLNDVAKKIGVVIFAAFVGLAPFAWQIAHGNSWSNAIRLGIDLAGGANLVYQAIGTDEKPITNQVMGQMVTAISRRINPSGTEEVTVRQVGADRIEVIIPGADPDVVAQKKAQMVRLGSLEFAILANETDHGDQGRKRPGLIAKARQVKKDYVDESGRVVASWREVGTDRGGKSKDVSEHGDVAAREIEKEGKTVKEFLVILEPEDRRVTGKYLTRAYQTTDESGGLAVGFTFNTRGGFLFGTLTGKNRPDRADERSGFNRRLAVLLDENIHSAPNLLDTISSHGIISGRFDLKEIEELIGVLNAGALAVPINPDPISDVMVSPTLGADVQQKGKLAIIIAALAVVAFMLVYYRFAGLVADLCLLLNMILVLGIMAVINATFTLPGLAGIVLTIGMAVDANVLIFERIREESRRGSSLRMAIQNGFSRAFTTIVDANVTTLIIAVVLYMIGTDQVRGFAVTLFIGIVMSMFTSLYVGRLIFDVFERKRWLKELKMFSIVGATHWDFVSKRRIAAIVSLTLIVVGMGTLITRGSDNLDIDFSGGTMVSFEFVQDQEIDDIRGILQQFTLPMVTFEFDAPQNTDAIRTALQTDGQARGGTPAISSNFTVQNLAPTDPEKGVNSGTKFGVRTWGEDKKEASTLQSLVSQALTKAGYTFTNPTTMEGERPVLGTNITLEKLTLPDEDQEQDDRRLFRVRTKEQDLEIVQKAISEAMSWEGDQRRQGYELTRVTAHAGDISKIADSAATEKTKKEGNEKNQDSEMPIAIGDVEFAGGHRVVLTYSDDVSTATAIRYLTDEIAKIKDVNGAEKYNEPASLFEVTGTEGPGMTAESGGVHRFTKIELKTKTAFAEADLKTVLAGVQATMASSPTFDEVNSFASSVAREMQEQAILAMLASLIAIVGYIWLRFQRITFGLAAVAALVHDVLVVLGMVALASYASSTGIGKMLALYDFKINLPMIAAFMTIVGYSLNDTIVVFDRIREVRGKNPALTPDMVNTSLNQTLARTILTSLTTFFVVLILYAIGGEGIHGFAFCLVLGVIVGTYSSIYVASPVLLWLMNRPGSETDRRAAAA